MRTSQEVPFVRARRLIPAILTVMALCPAVALAWDLDASERLVRERAVERLGASGSELVVEALDFARRAHRGAVRDGGEPAVIHALRVTGSLLASPQPVSAELAAAALLHDVVEDTRVGIEDIRRRFGDKVAGYVSELSLPAIEAHGGDKAARDRAYYEAFARASRGSHLVKFYDRMDNIHDMRGWPLRGRLGYLDATRKHLVAALSDRSPDLSASLDGELDRIRARLLGEAAPVRARAGVEPARFEEVASLTLPELLVRARRASGRVDIPLERMVLVGLITGLEISEVDRRYAERRVREPAPATSRVGLVASRGLVERLRERIRLRRSRTRRGR